jgi:uncharacterized protein YfcZ (UPF0381/DUF406 family)
VACVASEVHNVFLISDAQADIATLYAQRDQLAEACAEVCEKMDSDDSQMCAAAIRDLDLSHLSGWTQ